VSKHEVVKAQNSARTLKFKAKLKAAQTKPLRNGFLNQDKWDDEESTDAVKKVKLM
jgi:hypothetical protein